MVREVEMPDKLIPQWLIDARNEFHRLSIIQDDLLGKILDESLGVFISIGSHPDYEKFKRAELETEKAQDEWIRLDHKWNSMTPQQQRWEIYGYPEPWRTE
jgi:hypothetical protein